MFPVIPRESTDGRWSYRELCQNGSSSNWHEILHYQGHALAQPLASFRISLQALRRAAGYWGRAEAQEEKIDGSKNP